MVAGYPLSQHPVAPADCRNDAFCIEMRRKAYLFGPFVRYEHFLHECSRRANKREARLELLSRVLESQSRGSVTHAALVTGFRRAIAKRPSPASV
jgi:hypothetical protein